MEDDDFCLSLGRTREEFPEKVGDYCYASKLVLRRESISEVFASPKRIRGIRLELVLAVWLAFNVREKCSGTQNFHPAIVPGPHDSTRSELGDTKLAARSLSFTVVCTNMDDVWASAS